MVGAGADDQGRRLGLVQQSRERCDRLAVDAGGVDDRPGDGCGLALVVGFGRPVVHRDDHERGAAARLGGVECTLDRARDVLAAHRLADTPEEGADENDDAWR